MPARFRADCMTRMVVVRRTRGRKNDGRFDRCMTPSQIKSLNARARLRGLSVKSLLTVEDCEARIARDAGDARAHFDLASHWHYLGEYAKARELYDEAVRLQPESAAILCGRAKFMATCPDAACRNGAIALRDSLAALEIARLAGELATEWKLRQYVRAVACAHAELGDFAAAVSVLRDALPMVVTDTGRRELAGLMTRFEAREPERHRSFRDERPRE